MAKGHDQPIIIKKKKGGGHGHHGGAWKVAFADFMTAMFTLFLVLWLVNQTTEVKDAVANYFRDPIGFTTGGSRSLTPGLSSGGNPAKKVKSAAKMLTVRTTRTSMEAAAQQIKQRLRDGGQGRSLGDAITIAMTVEGLRISLTENPDTMFFERGSSNMAPDALSVLRVVGEELKSLPNRVMIEGHTDAKPYAGANYTNWELSTDRAHAARRILVAAGLPERQIVQVRGFADRDLVVPDEPLSARNRRITITVLTDPNAGLSGSPLAPPVPAAEEERQEEQAGEAAPSQPEHAAPHDGPAPAQGASHGGGH